MSMLDGRTAIVTGAGRGLGRAHALLLASQGARIVVNDPGVAWDGAGKDEGRPAQQVVDEIVAAGGEAVANFDSVADWKGADGLVQQAVDTFGGLDILVNNAGFVRDKMFFNLEEDDWDSVIEVHLKGHFAPARFAARYWRARAKAGEEVYGRLINTTSESGLVGNFGQANYAAAKAGISALTVVMARELARIGVTSNAIAPRARTRMTTQTFAGYGQVEEGAFDNRAPEHVSPLVGWLASPAAADITGQIFHVYGSVVSVFRGWEVAATIDAGERAWTTEELVTEGPRLFADHDPGLPPTLPGVAAKD
ncbi:SDR family oxidoreductase [Frankia sp. Cr1]|uniref:SDR family oxidoreductase n=1 Tax=Frankia sp. Cr1 TaxID=3073931 RepID=UPI002AD1E420|nr:SDR family oxidoreductase [Frankia sp. Cr1]